MCSAAEANEEQVSEISWIEVPAAVVGQWKLQRWEGMDELLTAWGAPWLLRRGATAATEHCTLDSMGRGRARLRARYSYAGFCVREEDVEVQLIDEEQVKQCMKAGSETGTLECHYFNSVDFDGHDCRAVASVDSQSGSFILRRWSSKGEILEIRQAPAADHVGNAGLSIRWQWRGFEALGCYERPPATRRPASARYLTNVSPGLLDSRSCDCHQPQTAR
eukprot:gnl/MRDRNA2_/MRDRNA2_28526_c0_seq1.p1 gnl/MRDRNA2_/MRDRNA2_28526_c0~~gnl/MRDRNA2_/MRDRNA2_28526_c0_seq1.p1  ORF type:complete len:220 (-),score=23.32 gnl/MRDRNA2_/MRDRNA2_28526_c0_seq1:114-773(-)